MQLPQLIMKRSLENLPKLSIPDGYNIREFEYSDEKDLDNIIEMTFGKGSFTFSASYKNDPQYRKDRVFLICDGNKPIGTASAWYKPEYEENIGYLHIVGVDKAHSGKKLGYIVSLRAMYKMKEEGREFVILQTDDNRLAAIKTYLNLGFTPVYNHPSYKERWETIFEQLSI